MISSQKNYTLHIVLVVISALLLSSLALVFGPKKGLILVAGLFAVFFIFRDPRIGLALTILAILNFSTQGKFTAGASGIFLSVGKILGVLTMAAWLFHHLTQRKKLVFTRSMWFGLGFIAISLLSVLIAVDKKWALIDVSKLVVDYALFFLLINLISTAKQLKGFVLLMILTALIASGAAIAQVKFPSLQFSGSESVKSFATGEGGIKDPQELKSGSFVRPTGTLGHPNWLSLFLVTLLPLTLYGVNSPELKNFKYFCLIVLACQLVAIILTHDRMGFLGIVFVFGASLWFGLIRVRPPLVVALCLSVFVAPFIIPATYLERVFSIDNYKKSESIDSRWGLLVSGLDMIVRFPFTGVGAGNYGAILMRDYPHTWAAKTVNWLRLEGETTISDHDQAAHNMYVEVASETGIFGLIIYLTFIFGAAKNMYRLHRRGGLQELKDLSLALFLSILAFCFIGIFLHAQLQKVWWIVIGLSIALSQLEKKQSKLIDEKA